MRGVRVPIHVIPRAIDGMCSTPRTRPIPSPPRRPGARASWWCAGRCARKASRTCSKFRQVRGAGSARGVAYLGRRRAGSRYVHGAGRAYGLEHRVFFAGEQALGAIPSFLRHADVFVYTSLSETYGQVISEAQWCRLPIVALADGMGVSQQIEHERTGLLIDPKGDPEQVKWRFAKAVLRLLHEPRERERLRNEAAKHVRRRARPSSAWRATTKPSPPRVDTSSFLRSWSRPWPCVKCARFSAGRACTSRWPASGCCGHRRPSTATAPVSRTGTAPSSSQFRLMVALPSGKEHERWVEHQLTTALG